MTGRAVLTAIGPSGVRRYRIRLLGGHRQSNARAATDTLAPTRCTTTPAARQRRLPDARICGGEVSFKPPSALHHSITSSARASRVGGISRPNAFGAARLTVSWYLLDPWTGRSAGLAPRRTRST